MKYAQTNRVFDDGLPDPTPPGVREMLETMTPEEVLRKLIVHNSHPDNQLCESLDYYRADVMELLGYLGVDPG